MHLGLEGQLHLSDRSREANHVLAARHRVNGKSLLLQPCLHLVDVRLRHAEASRKLLRAQPLVIKRRTRILLCCQQSLKSSLLRCCSVEGDPDAVQPGVGGHAPCIKFRGSKSLLRCLELSSLSVRDFASDAGSRRLRARGGRRHRAGGNPSACPKPSLTLKQLRNHSHPWKNG